MTTVLALATVVLAMFASTDVSHSAFTATTKNPSNSILVDTPPTAVASCTPTTVSKGATVTCSGTSSSDPGGGISSYSWSWGDASSNSSGSSATHSYSTAGTFTVTLTVTDTGGFTASTTASITVTVYETVVAADSPAYWWRLQDNAASSTVTNSGSTGSTYNATAYNVSSSINTSVLTTTGISGTSTPLAFLLNGSGYQAVTSNTHTVASSYTVEAWFKTTDSDGAGIVAVVNSASSCFGGPSGYVIYIGNDGKLKAGVNASGGTLTMGSSAGTVNDGAWHYVAATYTSGTMTVYLDGSTASFTVSGTSSGTSAYTQIGCVYGASSGMVSLPFSNAWMNGTIDEVAVYNSVLSTSRIAAHYAAG